MFMPVVILCVRCTLFCDLTHNIGEVTKTGLEVRSLSSTLDMTAENKGAYTPVSYYRLKYVTQYSVSMVLKVI